MVNEFDKKEAARREQSQKEQNLKDSIHAAFSAKQAEAAPTFKFFPDLFGSTKESIEITKENNSYYDCYVKKYGNKFNDPNSPYREPELAPNKDTGKMSLTFSFDGPEDAVSFDLEYSKEHPDTQMVILDPENKPDGVLYSIQNGQCYDANNNKITPDAAVKLLEALPKQREEPQSAPGRSI
jgi:hypothetical protein